MFLKKVTFDNYKHLSDVDISFLPQENFSIFPIISENGGGKSSFLQLLFTFLHCAFVPERQQYLKNILESFFVTTQNKIIPILSVELEFNGENINLEFCISPNDNKKFNFNAILDKARIDNFQNRKNKIEINATLVREVIFDLQSSKISIDIAIDKLDEVLDLQEKQELLNNENLDKRLTILENVSNKLDGFYEYIAMQLIALKTMDVTSEIHNLNNKLRSANLSYHFHYNNNNDVLLFKSNTELEKLQEIANHIYLASPNTQVLHFLQDQQIASLFDTRLNTKEPKQNNYDLILQEVQKDLQGLFNYDFSIVDLILEACKKARDLDFQDVLETGQYGSRFTQTINELNNFLNDKVIHIDKDFESFYFSKKNSHTKLSPKDLSHGELKKLSIYVWLKFIINRNSLILMDEVDIGLHPNWQRDIHDDLQHWSENSQFVIATHSPHIISKSYYKNIVVLKQTNEKMTAEQFKHAPVESDLNTIVKQIMGADYIPHELLELRKKYRIFFENDDLENTEALEIKEKILMYESEQSSFFKGLEFEKEFAL